MRTPTKWLAVLAGLAGLARLVRRRRRAGGDDREKPMLDPANELRRKLAQSRDAGAGAASAPGPAAEAVAPDLPAPEERRAGIHRRAHETIDAMRGEGA